MKKITILLLLLSFITVFSQDEKGDRAGTIFYPTIDKTDKAYKISIDLFDSGQTKYIEAELFDKNEVKLTSKLFKLVSRGKKYYISDEDGVEKEVSTFDINFQLEIPNSTLNYPVLKIKMLNSNYQPIDIYRKTFY